MNCYYYEDDHVKIATITLKDGQKQLQFAQSERNKVQSAYDALKKQREEHFKTCGKGSKVCVRKDRGKISQLSQGLCRDLNS